MPDVLWEEDYLLDLTKPYHNLLGVKKNGTSQTFYYDNNVTAMEENGHFYYYLQDELGSPLRVSNWDNPEDGTADSPNYLTYGYDEFGNDPGKELEQAGIPNPYSSQGEEQPFGYTGYRYDAISSTYFAQAREYNPKNGRFTAEDIIKGNGLIPETLNPYVYCWNSPLGLVDLDGKAPELGNYYVYYLNNTDGAKVFGHNALLLINANGEGQVYSYMGVIKTSDLTEFFAPELESAVGYAKLDAQDVQKFLQTGNVTLEKSYTGSNNVYGTTTDNYDRALYKRITEEEYNILYNEMTRVRNEKSLYSIYFYNCDTVVLQAVSQIDNSFNGYITGNAAIDLLNALVGKKEWLMRNLTPDSSFNSIKKYAYNWNLTYLGDLSFKEILLKDIQSFPTNLYDLLSNVMEDIATCLD